MKVFYDKVCEITQEHITKGIPEQSDCCAIALALREAEDLGGTDNYYFPKVTGDDIEVWELLNYDRDGNDACASYSIIVDPKDKDDVFWFIERFDERNDEDEYLKVVKPFKFRYRTG